MTGSGVFVVIGHVDHGKTSLVRRLTGMETDRLEEEKQRGLSIALGFAYKTYAERTVDFIDAPGHEDFIRTMISGASGASAILLVVSAVDGLEAQTEEHLKIVELLDIEHAVIALTKSDLVNADQILNLEQMLRIRISQTRFADAPIVACSALSGDGLGELDAAIAHTSERFEPAADLGGAFLPIDRVFTAIGSGTIVTGTLKGRPIEERQHVTIFPKALSATIRHIQVRGNSSLRAEPGMRVAVNLRGVSSSALERGDVLCQSDLLSATRQLDVEVRSCLDRRVELRHRENVRVHIGTASHVAEFFSFKPDGTSPADRGLGRLVFPNDIIAYPGQRFILRRLSPSETLAGGRVLDACPAVTKKPSERINVVRALAKGDPEEIAKAYFERDAALLGRRQLELLSGVVLSDEGERSAFGLMQLGEERLVSRAIIGDIQAGVLERLNQYHKENPTSRGLSLSQLRGEFAKEFPIELLPVCLSRLAEIGQVSIQSETVACTEFDPLARLSSQNKKKLQQLEAALRNGGLMPPDISELQSLAGRDRELIRLLIGAEKIVKLRNSSLGRDLYFEKHALNTGAKTLQKFYPFPTQFTVGEARESLNTTRKFIVPILEHYDAQGLTVRRDNVRLCRPESGKTVPPSKK